MSIFEFFFIVCCEKYACVRARQEDSPLSLRPKGKTSKDTEPQKMKTMKNENTGKLGPLKRESKALCEDLT